MPLSFAQHPKLRCPECQVEFVADIWLIVDAGERPDLAARCRDGSIHVATCPNGHAGLVGAPLLYHDRAKKQLILALPQAMDEKQVQQIGSQLIGQLRQNLLILPGSEYLDRPQIVPLQLLAAAIEGKLEEALAQAQQNLEQNPALAAALRVLQENETLGRTVEDWIRSESWDSSREFLETHGELLGEPADTVLSALAELARAQQDAEAVEILSERRELLALARREGIAAAYQMAAPPPEAAAPVFGEARVRLAARLAELGVNSETDLERVVQDHPDLRALIQQAMLEEDPLLQGINALAETRSPQEVSAVVEAHPILRDERAVAGLRELIANARAAGNEPMAKHFDERLQALLKIKDEVGKE